MGDRFVVQATAIDGIAVVTRRPIQDDRGFLERLYGSDDLAEVLGSRPIVQINRTRTWKRGTVRGMHYQLPPHAELKVVVCLRGSVFDVAVDVRQTSPTFLLWHSEVLSDAKSTMLVIPEGFAHGFQTLENDTELLYFHTAAHEPSAERTLHPSDPAIGITWPEAISDLSARDAASTMLTAGFEGVPL